MLIVLSPAKTLDFDNAPPTRRHSMPRFLEQASELNGLLRAFGPAELGDLMSISNDLAALNARRNAAWRPPFSLDNAKQALYAFRGDVYTGLDADSLDVDDVSFAQSHLRILSGLYGLLRPLDLIQPYRLEMGTTLSNMRGKDLYAFWGTRLADALEKELKARETPLLVNLASQEYSRALKPAALNADVVTPVFRDYKNGQYKVISFFAKQARGAMARWIIRHRVTSKAALTRFSESGYHYAKNASGNGELVFLRNQA